MSLIRVPQHTDEDLAAWERWEREDAAWARTQAFRDRCRRALDDLVAFAAAGPCYASTSWGKDSTVLAHLVWALREEHGIELPLVHVDCWPINNPHCALVRDEFLARWPLPCAEIEVRCLRNPEAPASDLFEGWHATGTIEEGFRRARNRYGERHVSGVRGSESGPRRRRMRRWGVSTERTCAPIGWWSDRDVYAYLWAHDLPVHPAYAMSYGGSLDRGRLRVAYLGLRHGTGRGRAEWEQHYYG